MKRKEFIRMCSILGVGLPLQTMMSSCEKENLTPRSSSINKVIVIGAGAGGLATAYLLNQQGIEVQVLEASSSYGGRMKRTLDFTDFPIPLGAEWLHVERDVFDEVINDSSIEVETQTTPYDPAVDVGLFEGQEVSPEQVGFTIDQKFINATWFDFFEQYIVPSIRSKISFNQVVASIDYSQEQIAVNTQDQQFTADRVVVSVPAKMLQKGAISFSPSLPKDKQNAIEKIKIWDGFKAFIAFSEKFYPAFTAFDIRPASAGQKLYYDAAYGQNTSENILGLFTVGTGTLPYRELSDSELIAYMLKELDEIFEGQATPNYIRHISQNWNQEPFIEGGYIHDQENWRRLRNLGESVDGKLFFAGCAYTTGEDWSSVHAAARSALRAVREMLG